MAAGPKGMAPFLSSCHAPPPDPASKITDCCRLPFIVDGMAFKE